MLPEVARGGEIRGGVRCPECSGIESQGRRDTLTESLKHCDRGGTDHTVRDMGLATEKGMTMTRRK